MCKYCEGDTLISYQEASEEIKYQMIKNFLDLNCRSFGKECNKILCPGCGEEL